MDHLEQENQELVQYLKEANADNEVLNQQAAIYLNQMESMGQISQECIRNAELCRSQASEKVQRIIELEEVIKR